MTQQVLTSTNTDDPVLTTPEVAKILKVSERTVDNLVAAGKIPYFKVGKQNRFYLRWILNLPEEKPGYRAHPQG